MELLRRLRPSPTLDPGPLVSYAFPPTADHQVYVSDRARHSGLTSLRFVGPDRFVACDFNARCMYLVAFRGDSFEILDRVPTPLADGTEVQTDLLDFDGRDLLVVSNFWQGSQSLFHLRDGKIRFWKEISANGYKNCHGVRFVPGTRQYMVAYCGKNNRHVVTIDIDSGRQLKEFSCDQRPQDVCWLGEWTLVPARTGHLDSKGPSRKRMRATVYLYREDKLMDTWQGRGHLDAAVAWNGRAYMTNQYTDCVDVFSIRKGRIRLDESIRGFSFPHGLDIRADGLMATTNYGDNTVRLVQLGQTGGVRAS